jgi:hypothetical protein
MKPVVLTLILAGLGSQPCSSTWKFESDREEREPKGFYFDETGRAPGAKWRVLRDGDNNVLAQLDTSREKNRFALAVVEDVRLKDVKLTVRIKAVAGDVDQSGGLVWRYRNSENYLVARLSVPDKSVCLYRVVGGNRIKFGEQEKLSLKAGTWYTLRVDHRGRNIKVYLDNEALFVEKDRHFDDSGKVGLWTRADAVTYFDDFEAKDLDCDE